MQRIVPECVLDIIEKLRDLFVGLLRHAVEHLLDEMLLVAPACFDDQFARRGTLSMS
jgi:hypothetical protein